MQPVSHYFNFLYLFVCIIWTPLQLYYLKVDGAGNTVVALSVFAVIWNIPALWRQQHVLRSPAFLCWTALVLFSFVNSMTKGFVSEWGDWVFIKNNFVLPFIFLYVLIVELDWDYGRVFPIPTAFECQINRKQALVARVHCRPNMEVLGQEHFLSRKYLVGDGGSLYVVESRKFGVEVTPDVIVACYGIVGNALTVAVQKLEKVAEDLGAVATVDFLDDEEKRFV